MKKIYIAIVLALFMLISVGFASAADTKSPTVTKTSPANGQKNVEFDKTIAVVFSENIKYNNKNIRLKNVKTGKVKTVTLTKSGNTIWINPAGNLNVNTKYKVEIHKNAVSDLSGNNNAAKSFSFTTRDWKYKSYTLTKTRYSSKYYDYLAGTGYYDTTKLFIQIKKVYNGDFRYSDVFKINKKYSNIIVSKAVVTGYHYISYTDDRIVHASRTYTSGFNGWLRPPSGYMYEKIKITYKIRS